MTKKTQESRRNETFDERNEIMSEWLFMFKGEKIQKVASVTNFEKHREIKTGLNEKCLIHFRVF